MSMFKYILKRLALVVVVFFVLMTICFVLIKQLEPELPPMTGAQAAAEKLRREALGYHLPIMEQYGIYLRNIITKGDWGTSWKIEYMKPVVDVVAKRLPPTVLINAYSLVFSVPIGILLGIWAAIKKNKITDHVISVLVILFISVPSFVYAFLVQYFLGFKLGAFPIVMSSLYDAGGSYFTLKMLSSIVLPILALSFGTIAGLTRFTRAELTEALTSDYMLLARSKGLTKTSAITRHALRNAMVPVLPGILGSFFALLGGSLVIEKIFSINGIGQLYMEAINRVDYDVFMADSMFYTAITLVSIIATDLSYGIIDPRIRMGEK